MKTYDLQTSYSFTKEACDLFKKVLDNQHAIINKHNEIEVLVKENSELFSHYTTLSEYITMTN